MEKEAAGWRWIHGLVIPELNHRHSKKKRRALLLIDLVEGIHLKPKISKMTGGDELSNAKHRNSGCCLYIIAEI